MEFESTKVMPVPAEQVFEVASDVSRMSTWLPSTERVEETSPNVLHVEGERSAGHYENDGLYRARPEQLRLEWGSRDTGGYAGWLQVHHSGDQSDVTIHLSFFEELDREYRGPRAEHAEQELEQALERLAGLVGSPA